jgi:hypothetical protein
MRHLLDALARASTARRSLSLAPLALVALVLGCPRGDVGAPCNHGDVEPPESKLVTFPALSCDDLLCVYADETPTPDDSCDEDNDCNVDPAIQRFECIESNNTCRLRIQYVLDRSMCSKKCASDDDCKDGGIGKKNLSENTSCNSGFVCARIQSLGEFCCQKLCVCEDDFAPATAAELDMECGSGQQEGCCRPPGGVMDPTFVPSDACGGGVG